MSNSEGLVSVYLPCLMAGHIGLTSRDDCSAVLPGMLSVARAPSDELFTRCFTPGFSCSIPNSFCQDAICTCARGYFASAGQCGEFLPGGDGN